MTERNTVNRNDTGTLYHELPPIIAEIARYKLRMRRLPGAESNITPLTYKTGTFNSFLCTVTLCYAYLQGFTGIL